MRCLNFSLPLVALRTLFQKAVAVALREPGHHWSPTVCSQHQAPVMLVSSYCRWQHNNKGRWQCSVSCFMPDPPVAVHSWLSQEIYCSSSTQSALMSHNQHLAFQWNKQKRNTVAVSVTTRDYGRINKIHCDTFSIFEILRRAVEG